jgi:hypothetical protein
MSWTPVKTIDKLPVWCEKSSQIGNLAYGIELGRWLQPGGREMRGALLFIGLAMSTASCVRAPTLVANAGDAVGLPTATDAASNPPATLIEMPPLYVDAREVYARKIKTASTEATKLCARRLNCPAVRVRRADMYRRADGTLWTVVRMNVCGEERVYEETLAGWSDATARLR